MEFYIMTKHGWNAGQGEYNNIEKQTKRLTINNIGGTMKKFQILDDNGNSILGTLTEKNAYHTAYPVYKKKAAH